MIPRVMSTQHPDNANMPFFARGEYLNGEDEIKEAYYVFSHFGCDEQMWDFEGKEVDDFVVRKLLSNYPDFFKRKPLGKFFRLTPRIPNPSVEKEEAKLLSEILEMIPRSYDYVKSFDIDQEPIFEVILPMTRTHEEVLRIYYFYKDFVAGKGKLSLRDGTKISEWLGEFKPEEIKVIPLLEDKKSLLNAKEIVSKIVEETNSEHIRVFLARSDPALNYGFISATIYVKYSLMRLEDVNAEVYPILGVGSCPFRGGLSPKNLQPVDEFPSVETFTVQSAFKYDYEFSEVRKAIERIKEKRKGKAEVIDEEYLKLAEKLTEAYRKRIPLIANFVNSFSKNVPKRRMRKLHIGLFGYSRGEGVKLPRAITFCASLYSIGFPPELLGIAELSDKDYEKVLEVFSGFEAMIGEALKYFNPNSMKVLNSKLEKDVERAKELFEIEVDEEHEKVTNEIINMLGKGLDLKERVAEAGILRGFLG